MKERKKRGKSEHKIIVKVITPLKGEISWEIS